jgi:putative NIF3 family GTP cyclohydrolase 1 type 2
MKAGVTAAELVSWVSEQAKIPLQPDEGVRWGRTDNTVKRLVFAWIPDWAAIREAVACEVDFLIGHESFFYPYNADIREGSGTDWKDWSYNKDRLETLQDAGIGYCRFHHVADHLTVFPTVAKLLELGPLIVDRPEFIKVYDIQPIRLANLIERVKRVFKQPALRVAIPEQMHLDQIVGRVGLPWGGMGLSVNIAYMHELISSHCDVLVAGESDNMAMRFAVDQGIPLIETSHDVNEAPGWRAFAEWISVSFPEIAVRIVDPGCVWELN